jgi:hypothetical protein
LSEQYADEVSKPAQYDHGEEQRQQSGQRSGQSAVLQQFSDRPQ